MSGRLILCLCGGVGGAKLAHGLSAVLPPEELLIVVNTGDDFEHLGLRISPDLDSVMYALAGLDDRRRGWGMARESWRCMETLAAYGGPVWFRLGDRDLATHLQRTRWLREGLRLDEVTRRLCRGLGVAHRIAPMSNDPAPTYAHTTAGRLAFQEYFARLRCEPEVRSVDLAAAGRAALQPDFCRALDEAAAIILCPSNPFLSIAPILAVGDAAARLRRRGRPVFAVSPLVRGRAVKGPAAKMMRELGLPPTNAGVAAYYRGRIDYLIMDKADRDDAAAVAKTGARPLIMPTLMRNDRDRRRLARRVLEAVKQTSVALN